LFRVTATVVPADDAHHGDGAEPFIPRRRDVACHHVPMNREPISPAYRAVMIAATPIVRWWGRLEVVGADLIPDGPVVLVANHDSYWDPLVIGVAAYPRRQIRALAKASLWKNPVVSKVLVGMRQIPVERGRGDLQALTEAIDALRSGACIGVFPEGTTSRGNVTRVHSGGGRIIQAVPEASVLSVALTGAVDLVRFPHRPRIRVTFFEPSGGQPAEGESAMALMKRIMLDVRGRAPHAVPGRAKRRAAVSP
jgi:1-acyl-sn-glycerol-3-phosphate acyltransferase